MFYPASAIERRKRRVRLKVRKASIGKSRLSVFRSGRYIYAQIIDDREHKTLFAASSIEKEGRSFLKSTCNIDAAVWVGERIARRALDGGINSVVFDRGEYLFHGRVKALAESARRVGLIF